jgi:hypothetical protein
MLTLAELIGNPHVLQNSSATPMLKLFCLAIHPEIPAYFVNKVTNLRNCLMGHPFTENA